NEPPARAVRCISSQVSAIASGSFSGRPRASVQRASSAAANTRSRSSSVGLRYIVHPTFAVTGPSTVAETGPAPRGGILWTPAGLRSSRERRARAAAGGRWQGRRKEAAVPNGKVTIVGAASSAGAHHAGQERAPAALRAAGFVTRLRAAGIDVTDLGDVAEATFTPDEAAATARNLPAVVRGASTGAGAGDRPPAGQPP